MSKPPLFYQVSYHFSICFLSSKNVLKILVHYFLLSCSFALVGFYLCYSSLVLFPGFGEEEEINLCCQSTTLNRTSITPVSLFVSCDGWMLAFLQRSSMSIIFSSFYLFPFLLFSGKTAWSNLLAHELFSCTHSTT